MAQLNERPQHSPYMPQQEDGNRPACAIPYELYADGNISNDKTAFTITLQAANNVFKTKASGSPFLVHSRGYQQKEFAEKTYALTAGDTLTDSWKTKDFDNSNYHIEVYGPNGFYRKFTGGKNDPSLNATLVYETNTNGKLTGGVKLILTHNGTEKNDLVITDNAYKTANKKLSLLTGNNNHQAMVFDLAKSDGWYDFSVKLAGNNEFEKDMPVMLKQVL